MFQLRSYQAEAVKAVREAVTAGHQGIVIQSPPRTGKTIIMADIARSATKQHNRVLFIVHRSEILAQARETFRADGVDMQLCQMGMVQTLTRHVKDLVTPAIIIVDEAHHALSRSYRKILDNFPQSVKLLFTATPWRMDGKGLDGVADTLIQGKPISWLMDNGFLAPVDYYAPSGLDNSRLKTKRNGEFDGTSIEQAMKPKIYGDAVAHYQKLAAGKQAIAYTYNVASAQRLADAFNAAGITARAVSGKTQKKDRERIVAAYRAGKIQVVTNAELFTEGLDLPNVDCVIMLRPTQSLSLYLQFAMRSMNPRNGKRAVIIDHVNNVERFGLPTINRVWTLGGRDKNSKSSNGEPIKSVTVCPICFATFYRHGDECPFCGALLTEDIQIDIDSNAELKKVEANKRLALAKKLIDDQALEAVADKSPAELKTYAEIKAYANLHGYKPGWAYFQAKLKGLIRK
ncbi:Helicase-like protein Type III restriction enzyme, res subunit DEAD DEAH box helicase-like protein [Levilactobacillus senmaizukei DSM 21775 = NBRC 103853]|uniref:Helicase-like protein Type III restriction enzyme, res subunit DEAD DEAH box helicase-like protein n=1 Tax=Levilactobacillus senmaizukei DSM 21775 = NBRC 103853 TaxID=1423803 RepID=A0A0R2DBQ8_9LACO|nr:DEAD/DEAH box helicase [Levilactobacillus senmaizukei]KRN01440.1 Helicase-like protein Type III restriction enzyme, res subunit DEAD DEAH box helicase-like protein [Levilactobacillus senmaizukei DSM 21775 = NBRC 103853]